MSFTSLDYLIFLPLVFTLYHLSRGRFGWVLLLLASYAFYFRAGAMYLPVVLASVTFLTYVCGLLLAKVSGELVRKVILISGIAGNVAILIVMKYLPFLVDNANSFVVLFSTKVKVAPPPLLVSIGVSFFVFQAIGYIVDIFLEVNEPERHPGIFALTLAFFPKLLQGPIERSVDLSEQFREQYRFDYDNVRSGMLLILWGAVKKMVVADRLAVFVDTVYNRNPQVYSGITLSLATVFYAFQLYFDFSGYTDMAIGSARLFNIRLSQNFNSPYLATSISDFWRRWHMTFSRWILGYIFKPLQMQLRDWKNRGTALALLVTFLITGMWHGAAWGFIVWGMLHGVYMAVSVFWKPYQKIIYRRLALEKSGWLKAWQTLITFGLVCFAWIFFRANSLESAWYIATHLLALPAAHSATVMDFFQQNLLMGQSIFDFYLAVLLLTIMGGTGWVLRRSGETDISALVLKMPGLMRWSLYYFLVCGIIFAGVFDNGTFIYFRF